MTTLIKFIDGSSRKLIGRYAVFPVRHKYLKMDCVIYDKQDRIALPLSSRCDTCKRDFSSIRNADRHLCLNTTINHSLGYVARICIDCRWYYEKERGVEPPATINKFINAGFKPSLL